MWSQIDNALYKTFQFRDFAEAFSFLANIALISEELDHHPIVNNVYNKVELRLTTDSAGAKVTEQDHELSRRIDKMVEEMFPGQVD
jgi:4a-hydroxytetrahydrobiopterin dehydratase